MRAKVEALIGATNAFDVEAVTLLFPPRAVIDDPQTGERFDHHAGIRDHIERFFIGYHAVTRLLSIKALGENRVRTRVNFTGDFSHEIGRLDIAFNEEG